MKKFTKTMLKRMDTLRSEDPSKQEKLGSRTTSLYQNPSSRGVARISRGVPGASEASFIWGSGGLPPAKF